MGTFTQDYVLCANKQNYINLIIKIEIKKKTANMRYTGYKERVDYIVKTQSNILRRKVMLVVR